MTDKKKIVNFNTIKEVSPQGAVITMTAAKAMCASHVNYDIGENDVFRVAVDGFLVAPKETADFIVEVRRKTCK